jgi:glycosyltransferase involved in cell wall biosynthesis
MRPAVLAVLPAVAVSLRRRLSELLNSGTYDLIHAHWAIPNGWLCAAPAERHRLPLVVSLHGSDVSLPERHRLLRRAARRAFEAAAAVSACSGDLASRAQKLGADPSRLRTIPYGVDVDAFAPGKPNAALRARLIGGKAAGGTLLIVAVGRLVEFKGFRYLIEAAARVPGIQVAIIGDGALRPELEQLTRELSAPVTFVGALPHREIGAALAVADIVVVPSIVDRAGRVDGLPNVVLETLAAGRPLIAGAVGGIPEVVTDDVNGLLVPQRDSAALVAAIDRLKGDPELRLRLAAEARKTVLETLSWERTARAFESLYEAALRSQVGS